MKACTLTGFSTALWPNSSVGPHAYPRVFMCKLLSHLSKRRACLLTHRTRLARSGKQPPCGSREQGVNFGDVEKIRTRLEFNIFECAPRRCIGDLLGPVDSERRVHGRSHVLWIHGAFLCPARFYHRSALFIGDSQRAPADHARAREKRAHGEAV